MFTEVCWIAIVYTRYEMKPILRTIYTIYYRFIELCSAFLKKQKSFGLSGFALFFWLPIAKFRYNCYSRTIQTNGLSKFFIRLHASAANNG